MTPQPRTAAFCRQLSICRPPIAALWLAPADAVRRLQPAVRTVYFAAACRSSIFFSMSALSSSSVLPPKAASVGSSRFSGV